MVDASSDNQEGATSAEIQWICEVRIHLGVSGSFTFERL